MFLCPVYALDLACVKIAILIVQTVRSDKYLDPIAAKLLYPRETAVYTGSRKGRQVTQTYGPPSLACLLAKPTRGLEHHISGCRHKNETAGIRCQASDGAVHLHGADYPGDMEVGRRRPPHQVPGHASGSEPHLHGLCPGVEINILSSLLP